MASPRIRPYALLERPPALCTAFPPVPASAPPPPRLRPASAAPRKRPADAQPTSAPPLDHLSAPLKALCRCAARFRQPLYLCLAPRKRCAAATPALRRVRRPAPHWLDDGARWSALLAGMSVIPGNRIPDALSKTLPCMPSSILPCSSAYQTRLDDRTPHLTFLASLRLPLRLDRSPLPPRPSRSLVPGTQTAHARDAGLPPHAHAPATFALIAATPLPLHYIHAGHHQTTRPKLKLCAPAQRRLALVRRAARHDVPLRTARCNIPRHAAHHGIPPRAPSRRFALLVAAPTPFRCIRAVRPGAVAPFASLTPRTLQRPRAPPPPSHSSRPCPSPSTASALGLCAPGGAVARIDGTPPLLLPPLRAPCTFGCMLMEGGTVLFSGRCKLGVPQQGRGWRGEGVRAEPSR
ncbi:hypothetical protein DFH07DRAFT_952626 [Mycena maculata]|uniref:Uncharacterized protein n=1 Tax=Mycena maculata TaxID=230809 RepID=A0AAD7NT69_9AGAR|nr:hypothetical protein DFH07DRAFT_952626 [Mycena maculata]